MNLTNDGNSTFATKEPYDRVFNRPVFLFIYVLIFVPSAVCNGLVCWIVKRNPSMHTNTNYMLINLAIADLLAPALSIFQVVDYLAVNLYLGKSMYVYVDCKFRNNWNFCPRFHRYTWAETLLIYLIYWNFWIFWKFGDLPIPDFPSLSWTHF